MAARTATSGERARNTDGKAMADKIDPAIPPELRAAVITRTFDAPRALVWQAWTEPRHIAAWWGPHGFGAAHPSVDLRVGGKMNFDMRAPDGTIMPVMATIREIKAPERLVLSMASSFRDQPSEMLNEITLAEAQGTTTLTLRITLVQATAAWLEGLKGMKQGWGESFEKMADLVGRMKLGVGANAAHQAFAANRRDKPMERKVTHATFKIERTFDSPPKTVFNAFADQKAKDKWFVGPADWIQGEKSMDFRVGGREVNVGGPKGGPMSRFECRYYDIVPNQRIVYAYEMYLDDQRISVSVAAIEFQPAGAGTRFVLTEQGAFLDGFDNPELREHGTRELVEALARSLKQSAAA